MLEKKLHFTGVHVQAVTSHTLQVFMCKLWKKSHLTGWKCHTLTCSCAIHCSCASCEKVTPDRCLCASHCSCARCEKVTPDRCSCASHCSCASCEKVTPDRCSCASHCCSECISMLGIAGWKSHTPDRCSCASHCSCASCEKVTLDRCSCASHCCNECISVLGIAFRQWRMNFFPTPSVVPLSTTSYDERATLTMQMKSANMVSVMLSFLK